MTESKTWTEAELAMIKALASIVAHERLQRMTTEHFGMKSGREKMLPIPDDASEAELKWHAMLLERVGNTPSPVPQGGPHMPNTVKLAEEMKRQEGK